MVVKMGVRESLSSSTPVVFVMLLLEAEAAAILLGSNFLVSTPKTGPEVSSYSRNTGNLVANSGWLSGSGSIRPSRSFSVSQPKNHKCGY